jgi:hypothetical protein
MSKKFSRELIRQMQRIRYKLDDMENCEDGEEMIFTAQELSAGIESLEESIEEKYKL